MLQIVASSFRHGSVVNTLGGAAACSSLYEGLSSAARSVGEASTSYSQLQGQHADHVRSYAAPAKGGAKKGAAPPAKAAASDKPDKPKVRSPMQKQRLRTPPFNSVSLLGPSERAVAKELQALTKPPAEGEEPAELENLKGLGLPLSRGEVVRVAHDALSVAAGQQVQFRPYVFNSVFQSAPVVADYVASALQAGSAWPRIERFFLSASEVEKGIAGMKVQVNGRMGRKASMSSTKIWQTGAIRLMNQCDAIDYGTATAMTRLGVLGVKVWIRYSKQAARPVTYAPHARHAGFTLPLSTLLTQPRAPLPYRSASAWWSKPGPSQPVTNRTWEALTLDFDPPVAAAAKLGVADYVAAQQPLLFRSDRERQEALRAMFPEVPAAENKTSAPPAGRAAGTAGELSGAGKGGEQGGKHDGVQPSSLAGRRAPDGKPFVLGSNAKLMYPQIDCTHCQRWGHYRNECPAVSR